MAHWYERRLTKRAEALPLIFAEQLGFIKSGPKKPARRAGAPRRRIAPRYAGDTRGG
jgi:hypothetical protein